MRHERHTEAAGPREFSLEGGCILCGGDLSVRLTAGTARSFCKSCRWISRPHMRKAEGGVQLLHPAGLLA